MRTAIFLTLLLALIAPHPAVAWMGYTHVYLANEALREARTGTVTIYTVDASGRIGSAIGTYRVDPVILQALTAFPGEYHAGLLGPDAFPDIPTGEYAIHPDNDSGTKGGPIADDWLERMWRKSRTPAEKAFVLGFLQHAAGDMFAHDLINWYTGGEYQFEHHNAIKHITLESYVQSCTPEVGDDGFYQVSVEHVAPFLVDTLIRSPLLAGPGGRYSLPCWIKMLRSSPVAVSPDLMQRLDRGLDQWPQLATNLATATMFNRVRTIDWNAADVAMKAYFDTLGQMVTDDEMVGLYEKLKSWLPAARKDELKWLMKVRKMTAGMAREVVAHIMTVEPELQGLDLALQAPQDAFDSIVGVKDANAAYPDHPVTRQRFRVEALHMAPSDKEFDVRKVPAAYNTEVACKLTMLSAPELRRLVNTLRARNHEPALTGTFPANLMLGFIRNLNSSHAWRPPGQTGIILDDASFRTIFMDEQPR